MQTNSLAAPAVPLYRVLAIAGTFIAAGSLHAAICVDANEVPAFGWALNLSGNGMIIGAPGLSAHPGAAYYHINNSILTLSKQTEQADPNKSYFGFAASASGNSALVGDFSDPTNAKLRQSGAAYYYKNLNDALSSGNKTVTETLKLQASDAATDALVEVT